MTDVPPDDIGVRNVTPKTRRTALVALSVIALAAITADVILTLDGAGSSEALLTLAATAVGGIAGVAMPRGE